MHYSLQQLSRGARGPTARLGLLLWLVMLVLTGQQALAAATHSATAVASTTVNAQTTTAAAVANDDGDAAMIAVPGGVPGLAGVGKQLQLPQAQQATPVAKSATVSAPPAAISSLGVQTLPALDAPVVDTAGLLTAAENQQLTEKIRRIYAAGRAQIGVVVVPTTGSEDIFTYATRVFAEWKLGDAKRDNGLLMVVAAQDRKVQILTGYGLEGVIPDILAKHVIEDNIKPYFKAGQYAAGLNAGVDKIDTYLQADPDTRAASIAQAKSAAAAAPSAGLSSSTINHSLILVLVLLFFGSLVCRLFGHFFGAGTVGVVGAAITLFGGASIAFSALIGAIVFALVMIGVGNVFYIVLQVMGGFGRGGGGFGGGSGGYGGGGGSFGGGGASGSW